jgi:hypothetical protein
MTKKPKNRRLVACTSDEKNIALDAKIKSIIEELLSTKQQINNMGHRLDQVLEYIKKNDAIISDQKGFLLSILYWLKKFDKQQKSISNSKKFTDYQEMPLKNSAGLLSNIQASLNHLTSRLNLIESLAARAAIKPPRTLRGIIAQLFNNHNPLFDENYYLRTYSDVAASGVDAYKHYFNMGYKEGRDPNSWFSTKEYLSVYSDVKNSNLNPLDHYFLYGRREARDPKPISNAARHVGESSSSKNAVEKSANELDVVTLDRTATSRALIQESEGKNYGRIILDLVESMPKRVGIVVCLPLLGRGGAEKVASCLIEAFEKIIPEATYLVLVTDRNEISDKSCKIANNTKSIGGLIHSDLYADKEEFLRQLVSFMHPEYFICINSEIAWNIICDDGRKFLYPNTKKIGAMFSVQRNVESGLIGGYAARYFELGIRRVDVLITDNERFIEEISEVYPGYKHKIFKINIPVSVNGKWPSVQDINANTRSVLWAGRLDREKRMDVLCDVAKQCPDLNFIVYGTAVLEAHSLNISQKNIIMMGSYSEPEDLLRGGPYLCYIHTTFGEGMPNTLVEVASMKIPIIAPDVGGIKEFLGADGILLSSLPDALEYVEAINYIRANEAHRIKKTSALYKKVKETQTMTRLIDDVKKIVGVD